MDSNGASLGYSDITAMYPGAISSWTRVGGRVTAPANSVSMQVQYLLYQSSGWVNIDDVEVTIVAPNAATEITKYYYFGSQRVAMRKNGMLTYLHADHLGSTVLETNTSGAITSDEKYKAYGKQRDTGTVSTDHRFTGQKEDASGLQYFNSRFYDPVIGMFVSPDTMVPQPGLASDYNRYLAFRGNPLRFIEPSGHDPLDASWIAEFKKNHNGQDPTWEDITLRLFSVAFPDRWKLFQFYNSNGSYISDSVRNTLMSPDVTAISWDDIPGALQSMAGWYSESEGALMTRDIGTLFGGLKNRLEEPDSFRAIKHPNNPVQDWVKISAGSVSQWLLGHDDDANIHHWAWGVAIGGTPYWGTLGEEMNSTRELGQTVVGLVTKFEFSYSNYYADVRMGNAGVKFGRILSTNGVGNIQRGLTVSFLLGTWGSFMD